MVWKKAFGLFCLLVLTFVILYSQLYPVLRTFERKDQKKYVTQSFNGTLEKKVEINHVSQGSDGTVERRKKKQYVTLGSKRTSEMKVKNHFVTLSSDGTKEKYVDLGPNRVLDSCILSFLVANGFESYLHQANGSYPVFKSFQSRPIGYDNIGKECSGVFYSGQHNDSIKSIMEDCFYPLNISQQKRKSLQDSLQLINRTFETNHLELALNGGSFIGSWRHHGIIPYDDDVDFYILWHQKPQAKKLLMALSTNKTNKIVFDDTEAVNQHWKLGVVCRDRIHPHCLVQINFFFIWQSGDSMNFQEYPRSINITDYYPLRLRPFENGLFLSPNNFQAYFSRQYGLKDTNICTFKNHANERLTCTEPVVNCDRFRFVYPYKLMATFERLQVEVIVDKVTVTSLYIYNI